jgi:transposase
VTLIERFQLIIEPGVTVCPCCAGQLHRIGEDISEMLDIVPAVVRVKRIIRPRYGCRGCESAVVQAPAPPRPIDGGLPTAALLAHVTVSKFAWHLPLHRQTQMLAGQDLKLDRSTLVHWIGRTVWWLEPLYKLLMNSVMSATKLFCDDTSLPVLDRSRRRTRTARLWCYAVDDRPWHGTQPPALVYLYAEDRRGEHPRQHLKGFSGVLQVDAYTGYNALTRADRSGGTIALAYCWAHARRGFYNAHKRTNDPIAAEAMRRIGEFYTIEAAIHGHSAEDRVAIRQAETAPLLEGFRAWLMARLEAISTKSPSADAIRYTLNHWEGLTRFVDDGRIEIDNNTAERGIRPIPTPDSLCTSFSSIWKHWELVLGSDMTRAFTTERFYHGWRIELCGKDLERCAGNNLFGTQDASLDQLAYSVAADAMSLGRLA